MAEFGLSERACRTICTILAKYPEVEQAIIYGSRAKGNYREGSDIDLTLKGSQLNQTILGRIWLDLDDSDSPYLFDLSIYHQLTNDNLRSEIDRSGKLFYQQEKKLF
ncbi:nucleotidyltransferase domain-containing protein [Actinobacillus vicugnae]|uniref:nucleotidyltransferase domain-containing protein n=1 Tax=Actinobacillus vicugnae TaxID=2573093 RepID=UPI00124154D5|nr:nucleotidyltransferase domain-containing protein [Actinobacillus vicugnae]